ncbi:GNAT family N-acetyltransferase [uncultured Ruminococcus sp.]|uniref:GNAT family N-acetyltransferase n=1 Tax=uncultured Ruminococcus sp. TaxID=165186 RepID=UPI002670738E|nr:GNAT family N-acetyltransferase [uncultured Ruminococcus sp.]
MEWIFKSFEELTNEELYAVLKLRFEVFVIEQNCLDIDPDGKDKVSMHLMLEDDGKIIGCARILPPKVSYDEPSIGRIVLDKSYRGTGLGREIVQKCIDFIHNIMKIREIRISGQAYLLDFYKSFGFVVTKGPYLEDKIPHYQMLLS